jgi:hypothetical protein
MDKRPTLFQATECRVKLFLSGTLFEQVRKFYHERLQLWELHQWLGAESQGVMFRLGPNAILELIDDERSGRAVSGCDLSLAVEDVWQLHRDLSSRHISVGPLGDREWGDTSFRVVDPSGFSIVFFSKTRSRSG